AIGTEERQRQRLHTKHVAVARLDREPVSRGVGGGERIPRAAERDRRDRPSGIVARRARRRIEEQRRGFGQTPGRSEHLRACALSARAGNGVPLLDDKTISVFARSVTGCALHASIARATFAMPTFPNERPRSERVSAHAAFCSSRLRERWRSRTLARSGYAD